MYINKTPGNESRKTVSKKKQQNLERLAQSHLSSHPSSRSGSRVGSRANSDNEESDNEYDEFDDDDDNHIQGDLTWETKVKDVIEELYEKRSSTREAALKKLIELISQYYSADVLDSQRNDLMELLKKSVKKGGPKECVLAAEAVSIVFITIGEDDEKMFTDLVPLLKYTIANHESTDVKAACIYTLGTACLISSTPQPSHLPTYELLNYFTDIALSSGASVNASQNAETLIAALESFSVLYASLFQHLGPKPITMQARRIFNHMIPAAKTLLEHPTVEVRVAAGEVIALMLEILGEYQRQRDDGEFSDDEESETYNDDDPEDLDEVTGDFRYDDLNGLVAALESLSTDSSRHRSRKERSTGRSAFRDILKSVNEQERPTESLKLREYDIDFDGWVEILQLHYLRDRLTAGFQTHFVHNTMIHTILPNTAILYSPTQATQGTFTSGSRSAAAAVSQSGSRAGSRAGSRPSSSMGIYADAEDAKAEQMDKVDRKYFNAEMAKIRQVQRKKERGQQKYDD